MEYLADALHTLIGELSRTRGCNDEQANEQFDEQSYEQSYEQNRTII